MPKEEKVKVKLTRNKIIVLSILILALIVWYIYNNYVPKPIYSIDYQGVTLNFRVDLREAMKIPVDPGSNQVAATIGNIWVKNVTIVYKPTGDPDKDKYYSLEAFEIANKLKLGMLANGINDVGIDAKPLSDFNRTDYVLLPGLIQHPLIAIIPPFYANQTRVYVATEHVVYIEAAFAENPYPWPLSAIIRIDPYKNLDLAVAQFLISALKINF